MSRMTTAHAIEKPQQSTEAAAIVAVMHEMQAMDHRWVQWRTEMVERLKEADALITGLHQDNANLTVRMHAFMRWAQKRWDTFEPEIQAEYTAVLAEIEQEARKTVPDIATTKEATPDEKPADHHIPIPVE